MWRLRSRLVERQGAETFVKVGEARAALAFQSMKNRLFVGRTDIFTLPARQEALVTLVNPTGSGRRSFLQAMTVTSNLGRRAIFWFDAATPLPLKASNKVANAHRGARELPLSTISFVMGPTVPITAGIDVFERLLIGKQTLLLDQEGKYIFEPGHNHSVFFPAIAQADEIDVAVAWWEEPLE